MGKEVHSVCWLPVKSRSCSLHVLGLNPESRQVGTAMSGPIHRLTLRTCLWALAPVGRRFQSVQAAAAAAAAAEAKKEKKKDEAAGTSGVTEERVKGVKDIPGPWGLPYIGTMLEYRLGVPPPCFVWRNCVTATGGRLYYLLLLLLLLQFFCLLSFFLSFPSFFLSFLLFLFLRLVGLPVVVVVV